ncbi:MAG TPA: FtsX-like permease family protein [Candidatus Acidoferrum sp.]|nr:FtsX-like permease family protein [Candidatus Acidoferrum sp.]
MKYFPLILANLFRKKLRTALTIGSFAVALFLFGLLSVVRGAFNQGVDVAGADRLIVINKTSLIQPLPISYRDRVLRVPGVKYVTFDSWFGGVYQEEKNFFPQFAIDPDNQRQVFPELAVPEDQWKAFVEDRQGAIAGAQTAKRFGWKVGDRIPIKATIFGGETWEFNLRGIYAAAREGDDLTQFWFHNKYLDERRTFTKGMVGWYTVKLDNSDKAVAVARTVDDMFANSPYETKTETEKAFATSFAKQAGNIEFLILVIGAVVFFTLLLVTGNTMAISVRERMGELAVLKAVGFGDRFVLFFILGESLLISVIGGILGLALCKWLTWRGDPTGGFLPYFNLSLFAILSGLAVSLVVGALAGILPAASAMRLRVVEALRKV